MQKDKCVDLKIQLNRIKGQVEGVERMIEEKRDAVSISQQISAVRSALSRLATDVLKEECEECFKQKSNDKKKKKFEELVNGFFKIS